MYFSPVLIQSDQDRQQPKKEGYNDNAEESPKGKTSFQYPII